MNRQNLYLATIDPNAHFLARQYGLGLEISEFCTAYNMDSHFAQVDPAVREKITYSDRFVLHAPFNELFPCAIDPKARELARQRYLQAIQLARAYGASKGVIHGGYHPWIYYPVWYTEQSIPFWKELLSQIPDGMTVCLENVLEEEPGMLLDIIKEVDDPKVRMCLDVGHVNKYSSVTVTQWLDRCAPYISHFHVHNNDGSWDTHSALPDGNIDIPKLFTHIQTLCSKATVTLELPEAESSLIWLRQTGLMEG